MIIALVYILAALGLLISVYFGLVLRKGISPDVKWIPKNFRLNDQICQSLVELPESRTFGIQVDILGISFYSLLFLLPATFLDELIFAASVFSIGLGIFLMRILLTKLHIHCRLCYTVHVLNFCIFVLVMINMLYRWRPELFGLPPYTR